MDLNNLGLRLTRRTFLGKATTGIGTLALASLLNKRAMGSTFAAAGGLPAGSPLLASKGVINPLQYAPKAKRVIYLYMAGGPSHLETLDFKPQLAKLHGQDMPESFTKGQPIAQLQNAKLRCYAPQIKFKQYGQSGQQLAEVFPRIGEVADELCVIRSMRTEAINHDPAHTFMNTGTTISGRPSMGSWITYGLGSEGENLPGFVVLVSTGKGGQMQPISSRQWHSGFLPSKFQGVRFQSKGDAVLYVANPPGVDAQKQHDIINAVNALNRLEDETVEDPEIATRVAQYEMAFKMQASVPELVDFSKEPKHILDMYGTQGGDGTFNANCLLARRMAERGVRFIQCYHRDWDHHGGVKSNIEITAKEVDQGAAALIKDLKQRDMLKDTLVIWGGEFGRTPMAQGDGRDHHIKGFSIWMAGGGIKPGISYGNTDELGYNAAENIVPVHDMHATMLHLLGIEHTKLTFRAQGRDFRLTDVAGELVKPILA